MRFPVQDWQFWLVTLTCAGAAWWVLRSLLPRLRRRKGRSATLTIEGQPAKKRARPRA